MSEYLLFAYIDITDNGIDDPESYPSFDPAMEGYFREYDNNGLKPVQLRFYEL